MGFMPLGGSLRLRPRWHRADRHLEFGRVVWPPWRRMTAMPWAVWMAKLRPDDLAHGVVEGEAKDLHEKIDGVAGLVLCGPGRQE